MDKAIVIELGQFGKSLRLQRRRAIVDKECKPVFDWYSVLTCTHGERFQVEAIVIGRESWRRGTERCQRGTWLW
jgi:hypothetical protein